MDIQNQHEDFDLWWEGNAIAMMCEEDEALKIWQAAKAQAVQEGFVLVEIKDLRDVISNAGDAMMNEETSSVYDITGEPSTWFDHYTVAEKQVLKAIEAQEQSK